MSSVHKVGSKPNWICFYTDHTGRRRGKSTGTQDRKEAERICNEIQKIEDKARNGRITEDRARKIIGSVVADILEASGSTFERQTIAEHFNSWLKAREHESSAGTYARYSGVVGKFLEFLGAKRNADLASLQSAYVERYRASMIDKVSNATVNTHLKVLRVCLEKAVKKNVFDKNPARLVDNLDPSKRHRRGAFKLDELRRVLAKAPDEWRGLILTCLYTGMRLSDGTNLTWANVDLAADGGKGEIVMGEKKKGGEVIIFPIARALRPHLEKLPSADDSLAPVFPDLAGKPESWLSNQFHEIMALAGLVKSRKIHEKKKDGPGRNGKRELSRLSFHSLRHTATSLLKNAGVSNAIAQDLIGHDSEAISRNYTHIDPDTRRAALDKMPDVS
jgi:integrase